MTQASLHPVSGDSVYMAEIVENLVVMVLTILVLIVGGYVALVLLNWGLKLKSGTREDDGLVQLWAESKKEHQAAASSNEEAPEENQP